MGRVETIAIGDELLDGRVLDSNGQRAATSLLPLGIKVDVMSVIRDDIPTIVDALELAKTRSDIVFCSGGLGPTDDDLTREAAARWVGVHLVEDEPSLLRLHAKFKAFGIPMAPNNVKQAHFPAGAIIYPNEVGTAPAFSVQKDGTTAYFLPGVPHEYTWFLKNHILPALEPDSGGFARRTLVYFGIGESALEHKIAQIKVPDNVTLGYRAHFPEIHFTVAARGPDAPSVVDAYLAEVQGEIGRHYVCEGTTLAARVVALLRERNLQIASAESCTGGLIATLITDVPGASSVYPGTVVSYANEVKVGALKVPETLLASKGAVSPEVAVAMAKGVASFMGADLSLAVTGVAGPGGGTDAKPVGTVEIALFTGDSTLVRPLQVKASWGRARIRQASTHHALMLALRWLEGRIKQDRKIYTIEDT